MNDETIAEMRHCRKCQQLLPWTLEFFHRHTKNKLKFICKSCAIQENRVYQERNRSSHGGIVDYPELQRACKTCGLSFPRTLEFWHKSLDRKDGLNTQCRGCIAKKSLKRHHLRRGNDPEYKEKNRVQGLKSYRKHAVEYNSRSRARHRAFRKQCIEYYGPSCHCCGEDRLEFLAIDHINGGGLKHRNSTFGHIYHWLVRNKFPEGFRVLCHNCNQSLGYYGYCPHGNLTAS